MRRALLPLPVLLATGLLAAPASAASSLKVSAPKTAKAGKPVGLRVTGRTDAMVLLRVRFAAPGRSCPAALDDRTPGMFQRIVGPGALSLRFSHRFGRRGTWRACAYLSTSGTTLARSTARIRLR